MQTNKSIQKEIDTKPYNHKKKSKTKLKTNLNYIQSKRSKENDKTLVNNLKQLNFNFNVKQNFHLTITVKS